MPPEEKGSQGIKSKGEVVSPIVPITAAAFPCCTAMDRRCCSNPLETLRNKIPFIANKQHSHNKPHPHSKPHSQKPFCIAWLALAS